LFARCGGVAGSRLNVQHLLDDGELLVIFPEGTVGIGKAFRDRYRIQEWRVGHAELAIRHRCPIVPVGIVGAEEQMPQIGRLPVRAFGAPYVPIFVPPFPLPVRYHVYYGDPIPLQDRYAAEDADDPDAVEQAADITRAAVQALLDRGVRERKGVFL